MSSRFVDLINEYEDIDIAEIDELTITDQLILENNTNQIILGAEPNQVFTPLTIWSVSVKTTSAIKWSSVLGNLIVELKLVSTFGTLRSQQLDSDIVNAQSTINTPLLYTTNTNSTNANITNTLTTTNITATNANITNTLTVPNINVTNSITAPNISATNTLNAPTVKVDNIESFSNTNVEMDSILVNTINSNNQMLSINGMLPVLYHWKYNWSKYSFK